MELFSPLAPLPSLEPMPPLPPPPPSPFVAMAPPPPSEPTSLTATPPPATTGPTLLEPSTLPRGPLTLTTAMATDLDTAMLDPSPPEFPPCLLLASPLLRPWLRTWIRLCWTHRHRSFLRVSCWLPPAGLRSGLRLRLRLLPLIAKTALVGTGCKLPQW